MSDIEHNHREFSQYYAEFEVSAVDLDQNPSALRTAFSMGFCKEIKNSFTYSEISEALPGFVSVCQKWDNPIRQ
jgi:hypothetical protein